MNLKLELKRLFCVGPIGFLLTIIIWVGAIKLENAMDIPKMIINPTFKNFLLIIFLIDAVYLFLGSQLTLKPKERGKVLITHGPFRYIRHPIYSAIIFSGSGIMAVWNESWIVLTFVLPLSLFLVLVGTKGRKLYDNYIWQTIRRISRKNRTVFTLLESDQKRTKRIKYKTYNDESVL